MRDKIINYLKRANIEYGLVICFIVAHIVTMWGVQLSHAQFGGQEVMFNVAFDVFLVYLAVKFLLLKERVTITKGDICLMLLFLTGIIAALCSSDLETSIFGVFGRFEGLFALACYYLLFLMASLISDKRHRYYVGAALFIVGLFSEVVGILSGYGVLNGLTTHWFNRATIPYGNPNFYGNMAAMMTAASIGLFIYGSKRLRTFGFIALLVSYGAMCCCESSGPITGIIMVFLIILVMELVMRKKGKDKKRWKKIWLKVGLCVVMFFLVFLITNVTRDGRGMDEFNQGLMDIQGGLLGDSAFTGRMRVWKVALQELPKYWIVGAGVDCFYIVTKNAPGGASYIRTFDKAHNEYLNLWLTQGTAAMVIYLIFLFILFFIGLKLWLLQIKEKRVDNMRMVLFLVFFAYIAQAFFNISVIQVAPYFWIVCGLLYDRSDSLVKCRWVKFNTEMEREGIV